MPLFGSSRMALRTLVTASCVAAVLGALQPGPARAAGLAISAPTPATFSSGLGPSSAVSTTGGSVAVTALGSWELRISGTDAGRLRGTGTGACTAGTSLLTNPLGVWATGTGVTSPGSSTTPRPLSGTSVTLATGNTGITQLVIPVGITYRWTPSASDVLPASCPYSLTATIDLYA